jgi:hypothetical protein
MGKWFEGERSTTTNIRKASRAVRLRFHRRAAMLSHNDLQQRRMAMDGATRVPLDVFSEGQIEKLFHK